MLLLQAILALAVLFSALLLARGWRGAMALWVRWRRLAAPVVVGVLALIVALRAPWLGLALLAAAVALGFFSGAPKAVRRDPEAEARRLLGVGDDAGPDAIRAAYRAKIAKAHPDQGGDARLARDLIAARDLLLQATERK